MRFYTSGEVMKVLRERVEGPRGKTQQEIARELGVSPQYLNDILADRRRLTPELASAVGFIKQPDRYTRKREAQPC
jgi:plasmid maintenance system antidote protein VapI